MTEEPLRFDVHRLRQSADEMTDEEVDLFYAGAWLRGRVLSTAEKRAELRAIWEDDVGRLEIVDVLDASGARRFVMVFFTGGSALVYDATTHAIVAAAAQHALDRCEQPGLWQALGRAYASSTPAIAEHVDFT